jgi:hypothetical protein
MKEGRDSYKIVTGNLRVRKHVERFRRRKEENMKN